MPGTFFVADGSKVYWDSGASWVEIRGVRSIQMDAPSKTKVDKTELRSTSKSYVGGKPDFGALTFPDWMYDQSDTTHISIETNANTANSTDRLYIEGADGDFLLVTGYFDGFIPSYDQEKVIGNALKFVMDSTPVHSASAPSA